MPQQLTSYKLERLREEQAQILKAIALEEAAEKARAAEIALRRQKEHEHMGWHPDFDPHDLTKMRVRFECSEQELPVAIFTTPSAQVILNSGAERLNKVAPELIAQRRIIAAETYEQVVKYATRRTMWARLKSFLSRLAS